jgi:hypothetical protein
MSRREAERLTSIDIPLKNKRDEPEFKLRIEPPGRIVFK